MPYMLQMLRARTQEHPDRAERLRVHIEALEASIEGQPAFCLQNVRTLFEAAHATIEAHRRAIAIDPVTPSTLYAGTGSTSVYKSIDGGATWTSASIGLTQARVTALLIDPTNPSTVYAGSGELPQGFCVAGDRSAHQAGGLLLVRLPAAWHFTWLAVSA